MWHMFSMRVTSSLVDRRTERGWQIAALAACWSLFTFAKLHRPTYRTVLFSSFRIPELLGRNRTSDSHACAGMPRGACYVADTRALRSANTYVPTFIAPRVSPLAEETEEKIFMNRRCVCVYSRP